MSKDELQESTREEWVISIIRAAIADAVAAEREACAVLAEDKARRAAHADDSAERGMTRLRLGIAIAAAIRARGA